MDAAIKLAPPPQYHLVEGRLSGKAHELVPSIDLGALTVDLRVQQPLREGKVRAILRRGYDPALVGTITVSVREQGTEVVVLDGQHRVEAARRAGYTTISSAIVWYGLTLQDEAWLFTYLNAKSNPTKVSTFKGRVTAGEEIPNRIADILEGNGWRVLEGKSTNGVFAAVGAAERIYLGQSVFRSERQPGSRIFATTIEAITGAWGLHKTASDGSLVEGVAVFLVRYWDQVDLGKLRDALGRVTPEWMRAESRQVKKMMNAPTVLAHGYKVHQEYNKRVRAKLAPFAL